MTATLSDDGRQGYNLDRRRAPRYDPAPIFALFPEASNDAIASALGVSRRTVSRWRCGNHGPTTYEADRIAVRYLGVHPVALWPDWHNPEP